MEEKQSISLKAGIFSFSPYLKRWFDFKGTTPSNGEEFCQKLYEE
jgi:hypothetical protein